MGWRPASDRSMIATDDAESAGLTCTHLRRRTTMRKEIAHRAHAFRVNRPPRPEIEATGYATHERLDDIIKNAFAEVLADQLLAERLVSRHSFRRQSVTLFQQIAN